MITSSQNARIKLVRLLQTSKRARHKNQQYLVEGPRLVEEILKSRNVPAFLLHRLPLSEHEQSLVSQLQSRGIFVESVSDDVYALCVGTEHPQNLLAVLSIPISELVWSDLDFVLICDGVSDPGNMGTLLRSAEAAGVQAVVLASNSVDVFNPKVVRSAAGAHLRLPMVNHSFAELAGLLNHMQLWRAESNQGLVYDCVDWQMPIGLIVCSEAHGCSASSQKLTSNVVHIPMLGNMESLNAAVAGSILMMDVARQRR